MSNDVKANLLSSSHWLRILIMVFFAVVTWVLGIILTVLVVAQALFSLVTGHDNPNLRQLGGALSLYFYQVLRFLTYRSEFRPFPFAPFPIDDESEEDPAVHLYGQPHAPARQAPVARPDFASEHEPEPAAGAGMTQASATTAAGFGAQAAATMTAAPGAAPTATASDLGTAAPAAHDAAPLVPGQDAAAQAVLASDTGSEEPRPLDAMADVEAAASTEPAIEITETTNPVGPDGGSDDGQDARPGEGNGAPPQSPSGDEHKHW